LIGSEQFGILFEINIGCLFNWCRRL